MSSEPPVSGSRPKLEREPSGSRGLPSVQQARQARGGVHWMPPRFWLWAGLFIGAGIIVWWKVDEGKILSQRNELMARQRAVVAELGPRWFPLREKVEGWTAECATAPEDEDVAERDALSKFDFRKHHGIYLRLAKKHTGSPEAIRESAQKSLQDGFTSCLLLVNNKSPLAGPKCRTTVDCAPGEWCNEYKHCAEHSQPFNLRLAYQTMFVMTDEWVKGVQEATKMLTVRGAVATFDAVEKHDLPVAVDLLTHSKYFLVVVDEDAEADDTASGSLPEVADAGAQDDRSIPTKPHKARVCVWQLSDGKKLLSVRRDAAGTLVGGKQPANFATRIARQRQANSCALALSVREAMGDTKASSVPPE
jgi:hypothetical protein